MNKEELREMLLQPIGPGFCSRYGAVLLEHELQREALELTLDPDQRVGFRSAAAVEHAYWANPESFDVYLPLVLQSYLKTGNPSAHRHLSKLVAHLIKRNSLVLTTEQAEQVAERAFDLLIDPKTKVAVQAWSMEILFLLGAQLDWIDEQLEETVRFLMVDGSPGMESPGGRICRRLARRRACNELG